MAITVNTAGEWWVLPSQADTPPDDQACVLIRSLNTMGALRLQAAVGDHEGTVDIVKPEALRVLIGECVLDWRGFNDPVGEALKFPGRDPAAVEEVVAAMPMGDLLALTEHVFDISTPSEIELGKLQSPTVSPVSRSSTRPIGDDSDSPAPCAGDRAASLAMAAGAASAEFTRENACP